jgi:hypothetical protein
MPLHAIIPTSFIYPTILNATSRRLHGKPPARDSKLKSFLLSLSSHHLHRQRKLPLQANHQPNTPSSTISEMRSSKPWFSFMDTPCLYARKHFGMSLNSSTASTVSELSFSCLEMNITTIHHSVDKYHLCSSGRVIKHSLLHLLTLTIVISLRS